jgi:hypothetical protein
LYSTVFRCSLLCGPALVKYSGQQSTGTVASLVQKGFNFEPTQRMNYSGQWVLA